ncbi:MAG: hypothetical protein ABIG95_03980 [Candidatus Woesearchaeota archaeon]
MSQKNSNWKLFISIIFDILGYFSYFIPVIGETGDIIFAPIQAIWIFFAYRTTKGAILGGLEELLPFTDFIPSCTIAHIIKARETNK